MKDSKQEYQEYLQSEYWQNVSKLVKTSAGFRCQVCNSPNELNTHHRTYAHRGDELNHLSDLICLCRKCHALFHQKQYGHHSSLPSKCPSRTKASKRRRIVQNDSKPVGTAILSAFTEKNLKGNNPQVKKWMKQNRIDTHSHGWKRKAFGRELPLSFFNNPKKVKKDSDHIMSSPEGRRAVLLNKDFLVTFP